MRKFWRDLFTGRDGKTYDIGRVLWFQSVQAFCLISIYSLYKGGNFDPVLWGAGLAALITGGGASLSIKAATEPPHHARVESYTEQVTKAAEGAVAIKQAVTMTQTTSTPEDDADAADEDQTGRAGT